MKLSKNNYLKARDFILTNARMIERRLFEFYFEIEIKKVFFMPFMPIEIVMVALGMAWNLIRHPLKVNPCLV
jgi:hypothetical protein